MKKTFATSPAPSMPPAVDATRVSVKRRLAFWRTLVCLSLAAWLQKNGGGTFVNAAATAAAQSPEGEATTLPAAALAVDVLSEKEGLIADYGRVQQASTNLQEPVLPPSAPTARPGGHTSGHDTTDGLPDEILIVAAVDGSMAGLSKATGALVWKRMGNKGAESASEAPPLLFEPLVSTTTTIESSSQTDAEWRTTAVPSVDGSVHLTARHTGDQSSAENNDDGDSITLTTSLLELAKRAPFVDNRGRLYSAHQRSTTYAIDGMTGEVLLQIPNSSADPGASFAAPPSDQGEAAWQDRLVVWLGRLDRSVSIHEPRSGSLDVQVGAAHILSMKDMVEGKTAGETVMDSKASPLLLDGSGSTVGGSLVATPSGHLAWRTFEAIEWVAAEKFDSPIAYAIDARSGESVRVDLVPDAAAPDGSHEYLSQELWRQLELAATPVPRSPQDKGDSFVELLPEEHTIVGALPSGQLYALPLGRRPVFHSPPTAHSLAASAAATEPKTLTPPASTGGSSRTHHHSYQHNQEKKTAGKPLHKRTCHPGGPNFPTCLVTGRHERLEDFAQSAAGGFLSEAAPRFDHGEEENAVARFFHPDYGQVPPQQRFHFMQDEERNRRKFRKFLQILCSWLAPTMAFFFVVSFEMGRRKRQQKIDEEVEAAAAIVKTTPPLATAPKEEGVIQVDDQVILGYGGHGTVVFKGTLDGRHVAVKRMLKAYHASADREMSLLIQSDGHPNVVRYFLKEVRGDFVYLALELCDLSLHELIGQIRNISESVNKENLLPAVPAATKGILFQIAQGVKHLHGLRIVHRDLKPANILLADSRKTKRKSEKEEVYDIFVQGYYVAKISDMGLGKQIAGQSSYGGSAFGESSFRGQSNGGQSSIAGAGPGSVGWQAPEVMAMRLPSDVSMRSDDSTMVGDSQTENSPLDFAAQARTSRSADVFSLGCIFYATFVPGSHPFGEWYEREANIMHNRPNMDVLKGQSPDAFDLVAFMIQRNPGDRPTAKQVCDHPFFWSADRCLAFLCDVSDRMESEGTVTSDGTLSQSFISKLVAIEGNASEVVGIAWDTVLDNALVSNVQRFRTYDPSSVRDLLRLIRNKHHHYDELPDALKAKMGSNTAGLFRYFESKFPTLLMHCYNVCRSIFKAEDTLSIKYSLLHIAKKVTGPKGTGNGVRSAPDDPPAPSVVATTAVLEEVREENEDGTDGPESIAVEREDPIEEMDELGPAAENLVVDERDKELPVKDVVLPTCETEVVATAASPAGIVVWECSAAAKTFRNRGWSRSDDEWVRRTDAALRKPNSNLVRCAEDPKFRTRLCNHWDASLGTFCPMRRKGKCVFAHGPVELRVKEGKKIRWSKLTDKNGDNKNPRHSGGEDTYGAARSIEVERRQEGKWNVNGNAKGKKSNGPQRKKDTTAPLPPAATSA
jgi:serine/threonine protein kinase